MAEKREVKIAVVGDAKQLERELKKAELTVSGFSRSAKSAGDTLKNALFAGAIVAGANKLVQAASDLEQAVGGTAAVFEDASGKVGEFSKNAAELAGLSEEAARTLTSRLGASLKGFGLNAEEAADKSIQLTQLGADLAATLGGTTEEAVTALAAALRGEFDPLEKFGIALKASDIAAQAVAMGLAENETQVSSLAKGQAALNMIMEKSAFAQGQFGREADTAAGQAAIAAAKSKNAAADLGKSFLPIYTKMAEIVGVLADAFSALPGPVQTGAVALTLVAVAGPKVFSGLKQVTDVAKALPAVLNKLATQAIDTSAAVSTIGQTGASAGAGAASAAGGLSLLGPAAIAVGAAAIAGGLAWKSYADEQARVRKEIDGLKDTFDETTGAITETTYATIADTLSKKNQIDDLNRAKVSWDEYTKAVLTSNEGLERQGIVEELARSQRDYGTEAIRDEIEALKGSENATNQLIGKLLEAEEANQGLIDTIYNQNDAFNEAQVDVSEFNKLTENTADVATSAAASITAEAKALKEQADALKESLGNTLDLVDAKFKLELASIDTRKAVEEYNEILRRGGLTADQRREAEIKLEQQIYDEAKAAAEAVAAQGALSGAQLTAGESALIQANKIAELAKSVAPDSPVARGLYTTYLQLVALAEADPTVKVRLETEEAIRKFREFLTIIGADPNSPGLGDILSYSQRAVGGPVERNRPYLVGENGPEMFIPATMGRILTAGVTAATRQNTSATGSVGPVSTTYQINVNAGPTADRAAIGQQIVEAIAAFERRSGDGWRA